VNDLLENQACEAIAQAVACEHSPAKPGKPGDYDAGAIAAAEEITRRIRARQERLHREAEEDERGQDVRRAPA
jgi:hypothetical protein